MVGTQSGRRRSELQGRRAGCARVELGGRDARPECEVGARDGRPAEGGTRSWYPVPIDAYIVRMAPHGDDVGAAVAIQVGGC